LQGNNLLLQFYRVVTKIKLIILNVYEKIIYPHSGTAAQKKFKKYFFEIIIEMSLNIFQQTYTEQSQIVLGINGMVKKYVWGQNRRTLEN